MIKLETIGMLDRVVVEPTIKLGDAVANYSFITYNGELYLVANTITGDNAYKDDVTLAAGEYLNGHLVKSLEGQKLVIDEKHITYGNGTAAYANIVAGTTLLKAASSGKLEVVADAPTTGVYFKITDKCRLTEKAVKAVVIVADATGTAGATTLAGLTDVDTTGATSGQVLKFDGTSWKPASDETE